MAQPVALHERFYGGEGKPPLVVLHGLLGSGRNWLTAGRDLARKFAVTAVDQRNHGESPHTLTHNYDDLAADLEAFLDFSGLERAALLGHSMGGKAAMRFACRRPERVTALFIADISPRAYRPHYHEYLEAMAGIDLGRLGSREEAERLLEPVVGDLGMRRFLLTNLVRDEQGRFRWQLNLGVLRREMPAITGPSLEPDDVYAGPALFLRGGKSAFIEDTDMDLIRGHFPRSELVTLEEAGHNVHVDARERFVEAVLSRGGPAG